MNGVCRGSAAKVCPQPSSPCMQSVCNSTDGACMEVPKCANRTCMAASCSSNGTCTYTPTANATCEDGNTCTTGDRCDDAGVCQPGSQVAAGTICLDTPCFKAACGTIPFVGFGCFNITQQVVVSGAFKRA